MLLPGSYSVTVEAAGFKKSVRSGVTLGHSDQLQINIQLEVGGATESVTVIGEAPMLDTSTVSTGRALTNREVMDLPVIGNNIVMAHTVRAGRAGRRAPRSSWCRARSAAGRHTTAPGNVGGNEWSIDGASTNGTDRRASYMPSPDVIDEFKIETSNFDASFGHSTGLNISMSTKSGANALHGSAHVSILQCAMERGVVLRQAERGTSRSPRAQAAGNIALAPRTGGHADAAAGPHATTTRRRSAARSTFRKSSTAGTSCSSSSAIRGLRNLQSARPSEINYTVPTVAMRERRISTPMLQQSDPVRYIIYDPNTDAPGPGPRRPLGARCVPRQHHPGNRFNNPMYDFYTKRMPLPNNDPTDPRRRSH